MERFLLSVIVLSFSSLAQATIDPTTILITRYWIPQAAYQEMLQDGFHPSRTNLVNYFNQKTATASNTSRNLMDEIDASIF